MALLYSASQHHLLKPGVPIYNVHIDRRGWDHDIHPRFHHLDNMYDTIYEELQNLQDQVDAGGGGSGDMSTWVIAGDSGSNKTVNDAEIVSFLGGTGISTVIGGTDSAPSVTYNWVAALIDDLSDVSDQAIEDGTDFITDGRTTWSTITPSVADASAWFANLETDFFTLLYDAVNDAWIPANMYTMVNQLLDTSLYKFNGFLANTRSVGFGGNDLYFTDAAVTDWAGNTSAAAGGRFSVLTNSNLVEFYTDASVRVNHMNVFSNSGYHELALGFYTDNRDYTTVQDDRDIYLSFKAAGGNVPYTTGSFNEDALILREAGTNGDFLFWNQNGTGVVRIKSAMNSLYNIGEIILDNTGRVQITEYGAGTQTGTPTYKLAVDTDGDIIEVPNTESLTIAVSDETTDLTTGTAKVTFRMPYAVTLTAVRASVTTAPTGDTLDIDINEGGVSILSTVITIDAGEKTSTTAAIPPVISDTAIADDAEITIDIDQVGSTIAGAGLKVTLLFYRS